WGIGIGSYRYGHLTYTHSGYMEFLVCTGLLGFLLYWSIPILLSFRLTALKHAFSVDERFRKTVNAARAVVFALLIHSLFRVLGQDRVPNPYFAIIIGMSA